MMNYTIKYYLFGFIPILIKECIGHQYQKELDTIDIHTKNGVKVIRNWSKYNFVLCKDWLEFEKENVKKESLSQAKTKI